MLYSPVQECRSARLLSRTTQDHHVVWEDPCSGGRLISLRLFKKHVDREAFAGLWRQVAEGVPSHLHCPVCTKPFIAVFAPAQPVAVQIDVCKRCQMLWFDPGELAELDRSDQVARFSAAKEAGFSRAPQPPTTAAPELEKFHSRQAFALKERERIWNEQSLGSAFDTLATPPEAWQWVPALLGMPVEHRTKSLRDLPLAVWAVSLVLLGVGAGSFETLGAQVERFGFYPNDPSRHHGLTLLSSFFLHGGWMHLVGNLYFLNMFGDDVEDYVGKINFLLLLFLSTVLGNLAVAHWTPHDTIAHIGASGGISGVLAFYLLRFPHRRVSVFLFLRFFKMPVWAWGVFYVATQVMGAFAQMVGQTQISFLSHVGGLVGGFCFLLLFVLPRGRLRPLTRKA